METPLSSGKTLVPRFAINPVAQRARIGALKEQFPDLFAGLQRTARKVRK
jgi:hypothetical protein